jgi:hypothetical protein
MYYTYSLALGVLVCPEVDGIVGRGWGGGGLNPPPHYDSCDYALFQPGY